MKEEINKIKNGTHKQFVFDKEKNEVKCKCGYSAVWIGGGYVCGTITAYPCKYNNTKLTQEEKEKLDYERLKAKFENK